jgi:uncharacterized protein YecT (DUF1311 family)
MISASRRNLSMKPFVFLPLLRLSLLLAVFLTTFSTYAAECDHATNSEAIARCIGSDLYAADENLNLSYKALMESLDAADKAKLRSDQLAWLKERNQVCRLSTRETDREKWYEDLIKDYRKAVCVARYSKSRTVELESMAAQRKYRDAERAHSQKDYQVKADKQYESGQWYYEIKLNPSAIALSGSAVIWTGCGESKSNTAVGATYRIRAGALPSETVIGVAIDLEHGKFYHSINGVWQNGNPGSAEGFDVKLGRTYHCGIDSTELVEPLLKRQYLDVNFGERPFLYERPAHYKPYRGDSVWMMAGANEDGMRLSFDYTSFNLKESRPTMRIMQTYDTLQDLRETNRKFKATQTQMRIDCRASKVDAMSTFYVSENGTYVATARYPLKVDFKPGLDTAGGRLVKSICFLAENKFDLPAIGADGTWDKMISPSAELQIFEAPSRRQFKNGYLLVEQKNETTTSIEMNGQKSNIILAISAMNCSDLSMHRLMAIRYGQHGDVVGVDYFLGENSAPKLPENRKRFADACAAAVPPN